LELKDKIFKLKKKSSLNSFKNYYWLFFRAPRISLLLIHYFFVFHRHVLISALFLRLRRCVFFVSFHFSPLT